MQKFNRFLLLLSLLVYTQAAAAPLSPMAAFSIFDDTLGTGWADWSWGSTIHLDATPAHTGSTSISVQYNSGWTGLYLAHPGLPTGAFTQLRLFLNGGAQGGQHIGLNLKMTQGDGPVHEIANLKANSWTELLLPLTELAAANATLTGLVLQNFNDQAAPIFYVDDISLSTDTDPNGPKFESGSVRQRTLTPGDGSSSVVRVKVSDPQGLSDLLSVSVDGTNLGTGTLQLKDDGLSNDGAAGDGIFGGILTASSDAQPGEVVLIATAQDKANHTDIYPLGMLDVLQKPASVIPGGLPTTISWGTNAWTGGAAENWQPLSGVGWNYLYQYITYGWEDWGGSFVQRFVQYAWSHHYVPVVTVYIMYGLPQTCGEGAACYLQKLNDPADVNTYLATFTRALQEARGSQPVIFNIEPDFYGYMQAYTNQSPPQGGVRTDDPTSIPVTLNQQGYANTLAGFGRYLVDLIHSTAPNALAAPMASTWAVNSDPQNVPASQAINMAQRTAAFINAMGGDQADLLVVEWSDRDAGSKIRPWWDDQDQNLPRPTRALLWENALAVASNKRLLLWQVPAGNMNQNNTSQHYQDNRAAYLFSHPQDVFNTGIIGVMFGAGDGDQTQVWTDGGFIAAQGKIAYNAPQAPGGLAFKGMMGNTFQVSWQENTETDLAGYRILLHKVGGNGDIPLDAGRRNSAGLLLPAIGEWEIRVAAYDAMGNLSAYSSPLQLSQSESTQQVYLPLTFKK